VGIQKLLDLWKSTEFLSNFQIGYNLNAKGQNIICGSWSSAPALVTARVKLIISNGITINRM
jgi:hypothetical protein